MIKLRKAEDLQGVFNLFSCRGRKGVQEKLLPLSTLTWIIKLGQMDYLSTLTVHFNCFRVKEPTAVRYIHRYSYLHYTKL